MRIFLFIATNIAVIALASVTLSLLGVEGFLAANGVDLNLGALLAFCAVFGVAGSLVSLFLSKTMAKMSTGTQLIDQPRDGTERWLVDTVRELAEAEGIGMPEVGDMVTLALIQGVVNTFVMFIARLVGFFVDRVVLKNERGLGIGFFVTTLVMEVLLGILAMMVVMWFSRYREFRADAAGARLAGRGAMISALERLKAGSEMPDAMPATMQAFGINQGLRSGMQALFASHPPLDARIAALREAG